MGEQLRAEADAEHRQAALDGLAEQRGLGRHHRQAVDVAHRLLAAERQDAVDLVERRQGVAVAQPALVDRDSRGPQGRPCVAR